MQPESPTSTSNNTEQTPGDNSKKRLIIVIAIVVVVAAVAILLINFMNSSTDQNKDSSQRNSQNDNTNNSKTEDISVLSDATLKEPSSLPGYKLGQTTATQKQYVKGLGTDASCRFSFGTASAEEQPGSDSRAIAAQYLQTQSQGGQVTAPLAEGDALLLKTSDGKNTYSLPTYTSTVKFTGEGGQQAVTNIHHSVAILKSGDRVSITRACVDTQDLAELDALAAGLVVTPKQ
jgi:cytoskeletal protein RodZ